MAATPRQDWKAYRPAIWLAMIGIAVMLLVAPFYLAAVPLGGGDGRRHLEPTAAVRASRCPTVRSRNVGFRCLPRYGVSRPCVSSGSSAELAITVRGMVKSFGDVRALGGVDLDVPTGTVLGLLGPNGAGKTTLVRILTTLLEPDGGTARVAGLDVVRDAAALRHRIGLAGQYAAVDEDLTGLENLVMVGRLYGSSRAQAKRRGQELLERFDLAEAGGRQTNTYSGGMRRRLDLAAALVAKPQVLFLDEPTTGLDPRSRIDLWATIEDLVAEGTTVLLTTQYLDEADRLADSITVIDHGLVIAQGTSDQLKDRVGGEWLEVSLEDAADAPRAVQALAEMSEEPPTGPGLDGQRVGAAAHRGKIVEAVRRLGDAGVGVDDITSAGRPSTTCSWRSPVTPPRRTSSREASGHRHRDHRRAQPDPPAAQARAADRLHVQPIMFLLLFRYVFGGAIQNRRAAYIEFLMPGIVVQNIAFGGFVTAIGLNEDVHKGLIDRFRSLPMARPAVLAGRTLSDVVTNLVALCVLVVTGVIIGFSFHTSVPRSWPVSACCCYSATPSRWVFAFVGLVASTPESANSIGFLAIFPLTFISSAFVPVATMPPRAQAFADVNPFTIFVDAMRSLWIGTPPRGYVWGAVVVGAGDPGRVRAAGGGALPPRATGDPRVGRSIVQLAAGHREARLAARPRWVPRVAGDVLAAQGGVGILIGDEVAELLEAVVVDRGHVAAAGVERWAYRPAGTAPGIAPIVALLLLHPSARDQLRALDLPACASTGRWLVLPKALGGCGVRSRWPRWWW